MMIERVLETSSPSEDSGNLMDFELAEEQQMVQETTRAFVRKGGQAGCLSAWTAKQFILLN